MIEIDHTLLSEEALNNLIFDIITRQGTDYGEYEIGIEVKKKQLLRKLLSGDAVIVYSSKEDTCDIIRQEDFLNFSQL
ncbi:YheU family protein [Legionella sp. PATHC038]|uniref:YheU family protein n=1 Tax=Legionella sheltonii TaxID=2992041 RepID=UPI0022441F74|nr:YheU family protein [Legionella sp. PATHC038]MCW8399319.1 YheU family protein [Legionella sp. PATHC038]